MGNKFWDTRAGWLDRGWFVPKDTAPVGRNQATGENLYSWGQVEKLVPDKKEHKEEMETVGATAPQSGTNRPRSKSA